MEFRNWKYEDVLKISELEKECFKEPWTYRMVADAFSSDLFVGILAEYGGEIVGYVCGTVLFENAELDNIAVAEAYRGQGIAKELIRRFHAQVKAKEGERVLLEVRVSNSPAMRLYLAEGYKGLYARTRYYHDGEDALIMQKEL